MIEPWEHGSVLRTPSEPSYYEVNAVRVESDAPELDGPALAAAGDVLLAGYAHRKINVEDETLGAGALPFFKAAGWVVERLAVMRRAGPAPVPDRAVEEVPLSATRALRVEWYLEYDTDVAAQERFAEAQEPVLARRRMRAFAVPGVGFAHFAAPPDADAVELEQLYVTPDARSDGIGGALVAAGLAACERDVAWVVADDEGRARALYERLGFETVWREHAFVLAPS